MKLLTTTLEYWTTTVAQKLTPIHVMNTIQRAKNSTIAEVIENLIEKYCPKNATILDVGCGEGFYPYFIRHGVKGSYLGIDINGKESWKTKEENGMHISFLVYDAEKLQNINQKFDIIVAIQSFEHIKQLSKKELNKNNNQVLC